MKQKIVICWFRQDLRLSDNPALRQAAQHQKILPIYILDDNNAGVYKLGGASRWWLHYSLQALNTSLDDKLNIYRGNPQDLFQYLNTKYDIEAVYWNRCYEPWRITRDTALKKYLTSQNITAHTFNGALLWEPWTIKKGDGGHYKVFTPYYRKGCLESVPPRKPLAAPESLSLLHDEEQIGLDALDLLPKIRWDKQLEPHWQIGEVGAQDCLQTFIDNGLYHYKTGRDFPAKNFTSHLSPYLHFGEISPNQLWHTVRSLGDDSNIDTFSSELAWREFSYLQLYYNPALPTKNLQEKFDNFPWADNKSLLEAWQKGRTGIPMVDAGMRELWQTGTMHNRVRMIVGSFLVKNLRQHWKNGAEWFWDTLVDADLASNSASWQWIAGCGADAAPYFRIFNPITQGQKFDPEGDYVRKFIPEIAALPNKYLFNPWQAPKTILQQADIVLGATYPEPIVDLKQSRQEALAAFQQLKQEKI